MTTTRNWECQGCGYGDMSKKKPTVCDICKGVMKINDKKIKKSKFIEIPMPPEPISIEVTSATLKIVKDKKNEDGRLEIKQKSGMMFLGILVKDLYRRKGWHKILPKLKPLYLAFHGNNCPLRIDVWYKGAWECIWDKSNHFDTFAEDKKSTEDYENFVINEGKKVAKLIDEGKTFAQVHKGMSNDHSGNTFGCAMLYGISHAKNKVNANLVRIAHNKDCGCDDPKQKGVANPALYTLEVKNGKKF